MSTRYSSVKSASALHVWWENTQTRLSLFVDIMLDGGHISNSEIQNALRYFEHRIPEFEQAQYPEQAADIRNQLLSTLKHLYQSLVYRTEENLYHAQSRLDMANAEMDAIRFRLIQFNILL